MSDINPQMILNEMSLSGLQTHQQSVQRMNEDASQAHVRLRGILESNMGSILKKSTELDPAESMSIAKVNSSDTFSKIIDSNAIAAQVASAIAPLLNNLKS